MSDSFFRFGIGTGPLHIQNLNCIGFESSIIDCDHDPINSLVCSHEDDVGIICGNFIHYCNHYRM